MYFRDFMFFSYSYRSGYKERHWPRDKYKFLLTLENWRLEPIIYSCQIKIVGPLTRPDLFQLVDPLTSYAMGGGGTPSFGRPLSFQVWIEEGFQVLEVLEKGFP